MMREAIEKLVAGENLSFREAQGVMTCIIEGKATEAQIGSLLTALRMKGETVAEITGFATVMRDKAFTLNCKKKKLIDTCGTGGDAAGTFNISTTAAFVVAAGGVAVAKHGNRSVSSRSGSADVLEALGININLTPPQIEEILQKIDLSFLFAPIFHKSMKHAIKPRKEIYIRTIFNLLGPLTNPARTSYQVVGVYDPYLTEIVAEVLGSLGTKKALVVHGAGGLDEVSILGPTKVSQLENGNVKTYTITLEELGFTSRSLLDIQGGDAYYNANIVENVLAGKKGPAREIVFLNSGVAFFAAEEVASIKEGVARAKQVLDSGKALMKLKELQEMSNSFLEEDVI